MENPACRFCSQETQMHGKELKSPGNKVSSGLDYCKNGAQSVRDKDTVRPGSKTGLLIHICMCTNRPRSRDRAYDLKNQSHKTGDNMSI